MGSTYTVYHIGSEPEVSCSIGEDNRYTIVYVTSLKQFVNNKGEECNCLLAEALLAGEWPWDIAAFEELQAEDDDNSEDGEV